MDPEVNHQIRQTSGIHEFGGILTEYRSNASAMHETFDQILVSRQEPSMSLLLCNRYSPSTLSGSSGLGKMSAFHLVV